MEYYSVKAFLKHFFLVKSKKYWVGQNINSSFSSRCSGKAWTNVLDNPIQQIYEYNKNEVHRYKES